MKIDVEREYLLDDTLAAEMRWLEEEQFYQNERNKQLPAIIRVMIPNTFKDGRKIRRETGQSDRACQEKSNSIERT